MFDAIRNNRRLVQVFLVLITLPFAFWGVESYVRNAGNADEIATVGGSKITSRDFQQALQMQQEKIRASIGAGATPEMLDTPQIRRSVLDSLINQRLITLQLAKAKVGVSDGQLLQFISSVPTLQENGKFSRERYEAVVAVQGMSKESFEGKLRQDLAMQQTVGAIAQASFASQQAGERWLAAMLEEREVAEVSLTPEQYLGQVKLAATAAKDFYETNKAAFAIPAQVRAEFTVLSQSRLEDQVSASTEDVQAWYNTHQDQYRQAEQRHASHILISTSKDAPAADIAAAKKKADEVLAQVQAKPAAFAALAKQYSQDPGSASKGGDLDWFGRGAMVKSFEDVAFSLKEGELSGIVRSDFGFHIIKLTGIQPEKIKSLDEVRAGITHELRSQAAAKKYAELAESFSNTVYEQPDSLKPAADKFKLKIEQSDWVIKGIPGKDPLNNPKLLSALFSDDAIKNKRNTEAVEVAPKTLVSAHVLEYRLASVRPFEEVRADIEKKLALDEAGKLSRKDGENKLARLVKGDAAGLTWGPARSVPRVGAQGFPAEAAKVVFQAGTAKFPAYAGVPATAGGYTIYRISQVKPFSGGDNPRAQALRPQYARIIQGEEFAAWLAVLRKRYPVEINSQAFQAKDR